MTSLLVIYPSGQPFYPQHEVFGHLGSIDCTFASDSAISPAVQLGSADKVRISFRRTLGMVPIAPIADAVVSDLDKLWDRCRPDIVLTFEIHSAVSSQVALEARRRGFRHVVLCDETSRPTNGLWASFPLTRWNSNRVLAEADLFVAHTNRGMNSLLEFGVDRRRIVHIYPGIRAPPPIERTAKPDGSVVVTFIGNLRENKGVRTLLHAHRLTHSQSKSRTLLRIAGTGPLATLVRAYQKQDSCVTYLGRVDETTKWSELAQSDLFVLPSQDIKLLWFVRWEEQTAIAAIEAMASGLPIVCTSCGSLPEIVGTPNRIVAQGNAEELAHAIDELAQNLQTRQRLSAINRARATSTFDFQRYSSLLEQAIVSTETLSSPG